MLSSVNESTLHGCLLHGRPLIWDHVGDLSKGKGVSGDLCCRKDVADQTHINASDMAARPLQWFHVHDLFWCCTDVMGGSMCM